ncbi:MAG TPA: Rieske 2Fe-2S domain-containing protein [Dehalococcoidia bacterium]|nr:Rieske 2Fe-2S domain-containing protein [Dehalococcoidia bacterium]
MLSREDNELVTNTNKGTPMGEAFRRFWLPVALASELPGPDCIPVRVRVLGEDLIAFRDTEGRVGLVDAYCPHRGAPMFFGRNEESGLRCIYHGWKFDVSGRCVDLPNAVEGDTYKEKVKIKAYPCVEAGDLIWAYMGPAERKPPFPEFEWTKLPPENRYVAKFHLECNYLQAMEGDYDPSHARFLHSTLGDSQIPNPLNPTALNQNRPFNTLTDPNQDPFPKFVGTRRVTRPIPAKLEDSDSGVISVTTNQLPDGRWSAQVGITIMLPIFCTAGIGGPNTYYSNMRVPIDNEHLMFFRLRWSYQPIPPNELEEYKTGGYYYPELIPGTFIPKDNKHNDYNIDRVVQKNFTYSGIRTFPLQDIAMMENQWGPIADRTQEHLTSSDYQIIHVRRRLLRLAKNMAEGIEPSEPWHPEAYRYRRASAIADTEEEAIAQAKAQAFGSALPAELQKIAIAT